MKKVTIVGSGVVGLCSAYYLLKEGFKVQILEKEAEKNESCSFGNAGMIVPSHFVPLAAPGVITKGMKWMLNSSSPFYIKPKANRALLSWLWKFYKHSTNKHVESSSQLLRDLNYNSDLLYKELAKEFDFSYEQKGLMMLYKSDKVAEEEKELAKQAEKLGVNAFVLNKNEVEERQGLKLDVIGGVLFDGDAHLDPNKFMDQLKSYLIKNEVEFHYNTEVSDFKIENDKIVSVNVGSKEFIADEYVIATGSWSGKLASKINLNIPMQGGKGYSFNVTAPNVNLEIPSIFCEAKVAVTPINNSVRFAGTMEINGLKLDQNPKRIKGIYNSINEYIPEFDTSKIDLTKTWAGLRPCSPDGLPYIGKSNFRNLTLATGHAMMGLSLGPISGKLVSETMSNKKTSLVIDKLSPIRFN